MATPRTGYSSAAGSMASTTSTARSGLRVLGSDLVLQALNNTKSAEFARSHAADTRLPQYLNMPADLRQRDLPLLGGVGSPVPTGLALTGTEAARARIWSEIDTPRSASAGVKSVGSGHSLQGWDVYATVSGPLAPVAAAPAEGGVGAAAHPSLRRGARVDLRHAHVASALTAQERAAAAAHRQKVLSESRGLPISQTVGTAYALPGPAGGPAGRPTSVSASRRLDEYGNSGRASADYLPSAPVWVAYTAGAESWAQLAGPPPAVGSARVDGGPPNGLVPTLRVRLTAEGAAAHGEEEGSCLVLDTPQFVAHFAATAAGGGLVETLRRGPDALQGTGALLAARPPTPAHPLASLPFRNAVREVSGAPTLSEELRSLVREAEKHAVDPTAPIAGEPGLGSVTRALSQPLMAPITRTGRAAAGSGLTREPVREDEDYERYPEAAGGGPEAASLSSLDAARRAADEALASTHPYYARSRATCFSAAVAGRTGGREGGEGTLLLGRGAGSSSTVSGLTHPARTPAGSVNPGSQFGPTLAASLTPRNNGGGGAASTRTVRTSASQGAGITWSPTPLQWSSFTSSSLSPSATTLILGALHAGVEYAYPMRLTNTSPFIRRYRVSECGLSDAPSCPRGTLRVRHRTSPLPPGLATQLTVMLKSLESGILTGRFVVLTDDGVRIVVTVHASVLAPAEFRAVRDAARAGAGLRALVTAAERLAVNGAAWDEQYARASTPPLGPAPAEERRVAEAGVSEAEEVLASLGRAAGGEVGGLQALYATFRSYGQGGAARGSHILADRIALGGGARSSPLPPAGISPVDRDRAELSLSVADCAAQVEAEVEAEEEVSVALGGGSLQLESGDGGEGEGEFALLSASSDEGEEVQPRPPTSPESPTSRLLRRLLEAGTTPGDVLASALSREGGAERGAGTPATAALSAALSAPRPVAVIDGAPIYRATLGPHPPSAASSARERAGLQAAPLSEVRSQSARITVGLTLTPHAGSSATGEEALEEGLKGLGSLPTPADFEQTGREGVDYIVPGGGTHRLLVPLI
jgi:hypothetical protein